MSALDDIPVRSDDALTFTGNVTPLLNELRHALQRLADSGETTTIDLRALPLAPGEETVLEQRLGRGEVSAHLDALGPSEAYETRFPGVWLVTHRNEDDEVMGRFLEVTTMPALLCTPLDDLQDSISELEHLTAADRTPDPQRGN